MSSHVPALDFFENMIQLICIIHISSGSQFGAVRGCGFKPVEETAEEATAPTYDIHITWTILSMQAYTVYIILLCIYINN